MFTYMISVLCRDDGDVSEEGRQDGRWRFQRALDSGGPGAHCGSTDASVRLSQLLKVGHGRLDGVLLLASNVSTASRLVLLHLLSDR